MVPHSRRRSTVEWSLPPDAMSLEDRVRRRTERVRRWSAALEEGSPRYIWTLVAAFAITIGLAFLFDYPPLVILPIPLLVFPAMERRFNQERPSDSALRVWSRARTSTLLGHPRFDAAVRSGLSNSLGTPAWITGALDFTDEVFRFEPLNHDAMLGFQPISIPWQEISLVRFTNRWVRGPVLITAVVEGSFGPPIAVQLQRTPQTEALLSSHGVRVE